MEINTHAHLLSLMYIQHSPWEIVFNIKYIPRYFKDICVFVSIHLRNYLIKSPYFKRICFLSVSIVFNILIFEVLKCIHIMNETKSIKKFLLIDWFSKLKISLFFYLYMLNIFAATIPSKKKKKKKIFI